MSHNIVLTFALLYGAFIALICAIFVALGVRKKRLQNQQLVKEEIIQEE